MAESEITTEELKKEITAILDNESLENTSTKKVIQKLEKKLGVDLTAKKKLIDQLVMDYVNSMDSDEDSADEEPEKPAKVAPKKKAKKEDDEEDDDDRDDSNDSDWGYHHDGHLLDGYPDENCHPCHQESTITTSGTRQLSNRPRKALILKRVAQTSREEDEADIFGKLTAKKLRKLSDEQRDSMMVQINQLFYDRSHNPTPPKRKMEDKATSTPRIKYEAKKIYRVGAIQTNLSGAGIPLASVQLSNMPRPIVNHICENHTYIPRTVVPPSNVPEPVVQVATTPKPVEMPPNQEATENKSGKKKKVEEKKKKAAPKSKKEKTKKGGAAGGVAKKKGGGKGSGYTRACKLSPELAELMGESELPRHEVVKRVWAIIKEKQLFDPKNRQFAICDKALFKVIGEETFRTFSMMKYLKNHFLD